MLGPLKMRWSDDSSAVFPYCPVTSSLIYVPGVASITDAYLADGQKELARQNAKRALELLPTDPTQNEQRRAGIKASAEQKLKQLGEDPK